MNTAFNNAKLKEEFDTEKSFLEENRTGNRDQLSSRQQSRPNTTVNTQFQQKKLSGVSTPGINASGDVSSMLQTFNVKDIRYDSSLNSTQTGAVPWNKKFNYEI